MLRNIFSCIVLLICVSGYAYAQEEKEVTRFDVRDFYFYDKTNLMQRLILAPKIMVNFLKQLPDEDIMAFLNKFPLARQQKDPTQSFRYVLAFPASISAQSLMDTLMEINGSDIAEGIPVVLIDNVEAIAEGFVVESRTPLAPVMLGAHLKKIGKFSIRQVAPEGHGWFFIVDEIKPPLHIYPLINLIHNDPWVKSAYLKFQYLHPAIVSTLEVSPVSGTVDETRTVTLFVRVFDPEIKVLTNLLPNFGEGKFQPNPMPPLLFFFPAVGKREESKELSDARGRIFSLQWRFRLFTPGEWTIPAQVIHYERKGEQLTITSVPVPFVVTSLIGSLAINDMPSPKLLAVPGKMSDVAVVEASPLFPPYWFDRWMSEVLLVARISYGTAIGLSLMGVGFPIFWGGHLLRKRMKMKSDRKALIRTWRTVCIYPDYDIVVSLKSYEKLEHTLVSLLSLAFGNQLPARPILKDVEEQVRDAFNDDQWGALCMLYEELGSVHARNFVPDRKAFNGAAEQLLGLIYYLTPMIDFSKKGLIWKSLR